MTRWKLKDKNGKFRSRRSFKQDLKEDSNELWEQRRRKGKSLKKKMFDFIGKSKNIMD